MATSWCSILRGVRTARSYLSAPTTIRTFSFSKVQRGTLLPHCNTSILRLQKYHFISVTFCRTLWIQSRKALPVSSPVFRMGMRSQRANYSTQSGYTDRIKVVLKEYGPVALIFHTVISLMSLGTCYLLVDNGLDVAKILKYFNVKTESSSIAKGASTFAIAYVFHKFLLPLRATITIVSVPMIVRSLRARGWMKDPISKVKSSVKKLRK